MSGFAIRDWGANRYQVFLSSGFLGLHGRHTPDPELHVGAGMAMAPAIVDDFGDLVIVGRWS